MGKPTICIGENKDADQLLALFCVCTGRFVSDLFGNHIVGFPTRFVSDLFGNHIVGFPTRWLISLL